MQADTLYFGDNLQVLREQLPDASVDLVYLDPPFNSQRDYNYIYRDIASASDTAQEQAFSDTWTMEGAAAEFGEVTLSGHPEGKLIDTLHQLFGDTALIAYLSVMALRLRELHRVLKPTGSLYLHCDPTASHYLKLVLDCIFGGDRAGNELIWQRSTPKGLAFTRFASNHDVLLRYTRSERWTWNAVYTPHDESYVERFYRHVEPETGRRYQLTDLTNPNRNRPNLTYEFLGVTRVWRWTRERMQEAYDAGLIVQTKPGSVPRFKRYLDEQEGTPVGDVWTDIRPVGGMVAAEPSLGYPTQKPLALLERIISASSNEGDLVLDPFCGCGTAVVAAQKLNRRWIGIDITSLAVNLIRERLSDHFPELWPMPGDVPVAGLPRDVAGARLLFETNPYDFQFWALTLVGAHPPGGRRKKGADRGIDGEILWRDGQDQLQRAVVSVKGGRHVGDAMLKDLIATVEAENAAVGLMVTLAGPTRPMRQRAAQAGEYQYAARELSDHVTACFPRIQILTIEELLEGRRPELPRTSRLARHREAKEIKGDSPQQLLDFGGE